MKLVLAPLWLLLALAPLGLAPDVASAAPAPGDVGRVSDRELNELGQRFAEALNTRDSAAVQKLLDLDATSERALASVGSETAKWSPERRIAFRELCRKGTARTGAGLVASMTPTSKAKHMQIVDSGPNRVALVRVDLDDDGFSYLELYPSPKGASGVRVIDLYDYARGQLGSALEAELARAATEDLDKLAVDDPSAEVTGRRASTAFLRAAAAGENERALALYAGLPKAVQENRLFLLLRVELADGNESRHAEALTALANRFADDPSLGLVLMEHYILTGDHAGGLRNLRTVLGRLPADGLLLSMTASHYSLMGDHAQAATAARRAIETEPDFENGYFLLAEALLARKDYGGALTTWGVIEKRFGYAFTPADFESDAEYAGLVQSPAYAKWKQAREQQAPAPKAAVNAP
jgi:tetratricopeptide (TPR) repeat protein